MLKAIVTLLLIPMTILSIISIAALVSPFYVYDMLTKLPVDIENVVVGIVGGSQYSPFVIIGLTLWLFWVRGRIR
jgi:hypothetical protein